MFTISQFSKLSGISRKLLIYYDNSGLFSPDYIAENGYRYYSFDQLFQVTVILVLKDLGMSLDDIKNYMNNYSPHDEISILEKQDEKISMKIKQLESSQDMLRSRLLRAKSGIAVNMSTIEIAEQKETMIHISESFHGTRKEDITFEEWDQFCSNCYDQGISYGYADGYIINKENLLLGNTDRIEHIAFFVENKKYSNAVIPSGKYVIAHCNGEFDEIRKTYDKMLKYIKENDLKIIGNAYEEVLLDEVSTKKRKLQILKIKIQIKP